MKDDDDDVKDDDNNSMDTPQGMHGTEAGSFAGSLCGYWFLCVFLVLVFLIGL